MNKIVLVFFLYLVITLGVIYSWFHYGLMYGGGDVGLPTYNPQSVLKIVTKSWWTETAPGFPRAQNLAALPAYVFFAFLQQIGLPDFMIQAVVFGILLFLMGFGMYLLARCFLKNTGMAILAGFFYMVNPYMMVLVWHRFTHTTFFFAAALPLLLLLWRKWLKEREYISLILFIAVNLIFSYMFTTLAYVITLWSLLSLYTLFEIFIPWIGKEKAIKIMAVFSTGLFLWILTNTWWILPIFFILPNLVSAQHATNDTISTLFAIGEQSIIPYALPGLNSFYLFQGQELGEVFKHPLFLSIPWIGVFFITVGIYYTKKNRELIYWSMLFIIAVFLAKGTAPPLGYFYPYLFEKFFFLGILRNPFEKFGILIPFVSSMLFSIGFFNLATYFWKKNILVGKAMIILSFGLFFGIYHWPFWAGTLFGTLEKRNFVEIPPYYKQANLWVQDQKKDGNILHLPLAIAESSTYMWQYGYSGAESNVGFFTSNPSISMGFNLSYLDDALRGVDLMTNLDYTKNSEYLKELFRAFNVRFIILHSDINWQASGVQSPKKIEGILDSLPFLKKQKEIGKLTIYEMEDNAFLSKIYLSPYFNSVIFGKNYNSWFWFLKNSPYPFLSDASGSKELQNLSGEEEKLIFPQLGIRISDTKLVSRENALEELPAIRFLPDSLLYPLILFKEFIQQRAFQLPLENPALGYAGKRLNEAYRMLDKNPRYSISEVMKAYIGYLNKAAANILDSGVTQGGPPVWLRQIFARHQIVLEQINEKAQEDNKTKVSDALSVLRQKMIDMNMQTIYGLISKKDLGSGQQVYRFSIPVDGEYEILMASSKMTLYQTNLNSLDLQIDNIVQSRNAQLKDNLISYGMVPLKVGQHEISYNMQRSVNLVKDRQEEIKLISGKHKPNEYEIKIDSFHPNSTYIISFEYWTQAGSDPVVRVLQNSDQVNYLADNELFKQKDYQFIEQVKLDQYNKYWKTYDFAISPRKNSDNFLLNIISIPWDGCSSFLSGHRLCDKPQVRFNFQESSSIAIRNIQVMRILDNPLFLRSNSTNQTSQIVSLNYTKKAPLEYEGNLSLDKPSYIIFSETFNDNWELTLFDGEKEYGIPKHFLANMYSNGWYIDKTGNYKFRIRFSADKYLYLGIYISVSSLLVFTGIYLIGKYLKRNYEKKD